MILKELSEAVGTSGNEGDVRTVLLDAVREHVDDGSVCVNLPSNMMTYRQKAPIPLGLQIPSH